MRYKRFQAGLVVQGDAFDSEVMSTVDAECGKEINHYIPAFSLIICDPPYGEITDEKWDNAEYLRWFDHCARVCADNGTIVMWGGIGKHQNRPFLEFAASIEKQRPFWRILNWITWAKKRAYGKARDYLFTREEMLILVNGNEYTFNIPLLDKKRGYTGYNPKYPAKSEFLRRTNVWSDITEMFRDKIHPTQKPDELYKVIIETHSKETDTVYDPCAGSGTTARAAMSTGRRFCIVEREVSYLRAAGLLDRE
jgi:DNA modification methylase